MRQFCIMGNKNIKKKKKKKKKKESKKKAKRLYKNK